MKRECSSADRARHRAVQGRGSSVHQLRYLHRAIHPVHDLHAYMELRNVLRDYAPDLVSSHTAKAGWLGRAAARALPLKSIYTPHGWAISDRISRTQGSVYTIAENAAPWAEPSSASLKRKSRSHKASRAGSQAPRHPQRRPRHPSGTLRPAGQEPVRLFSVARFEAPKDHITLLGYVGDR